MGTNLIVSTGAVSCYPASIVNLIWFVGDKFFWSFTVAATKKRAKQFHLRVCEDSWNFTCWSKTVHYRTPRLQNGCVFGSRDAWFHVPILLNADTINIFH